MPEFGGPPIDQVAKSPLKTEAYIERKAPRSSPIPNAITHVNKQV